MGFEAGGRADKSGNVYENRILAEHLLRLILEKISSIEVEPLGREGEGIEFVVTETDGTRCYYQCKASNGVQQHWRPSDILRHRVFQTAKQRIQSEPNRHYHFVSPVSYDELDSLCDRARRCNDMEDFLKHQLTNEPLRKWWDAVKQQLSGDDVDRGADLDEEAFSLLTNCYFEQISFSPTQEQQLENQIAILFTRPNKETPSTIRILLENYANDQQRWGKPITASEVVGWLEQQGYPLRLLPRDERSLPVVRSLNRNYRESFHPVGGSVFHRQESDQILAHIRAGRSVVVLGKAGSG
ncbi:MAG: hypothetical protein IJC43_00495, partial [Clostridia bacterium]|nr:hypothetical protein [Clostridia bacterium]